MLACENICHTIEAAQILCKRESSHLTFPGEHLSCREASVTTCGIENSIGGSAGWTAGWKREGAVLSPVGRSRACHVTVSTRAGAVPRPNPMEPLPPAPRAKALRGRMGRTGFFLLFSLSSFLSFFLSNRLHFPRIVLDLQKKLSIKYSLSVTSCISGVRLLQA